MWGLGADEDQAEVRGIPAEEAPSPGVPDSLSDASGVLSAVMNSLGVDVQPTALQLKSIADARARAGAVLARWNAAKTEAAGLNLKLKAAGASGLEVPKFE